MSMSQEEIEALMSGLDIQEDESPAVEEQDVPAETIEDENASMSEDDIADLIAQTDIPAEETADTPVAEETPVIETSEAIEEVSEDEVDEIINNIEEVAQEAEPEEENIDDILAGIEGVTDDTPPAKAKQNSGPDKDAIGKDWTDNKIDEGVFPFPVEKNTKVVNQLSEVAHDSEEKASKIFDVLSFILDENNEKDVIYVVRVDNGSPGLQYVQVNQKAVKYQILKGYLKFDNAGVFREIYYANEKIWRIY